VCICVQYRACTVPYKLFAYVWSTQEPLAAIPGCPCAVAAGAVVCICGRRASEHCPDKENHTVQSAVRKKTARLEHLKILALQRGFRMLKKTVLRWVSTRHLRNYD
jgi:hypothetical protein